MTLLYLHLLCYNRLSGVLHALASYACLRLACMQSRLYVLGLAVIWVKVLFETLRAQMNYQAVLVTMRVITETHMTGVRIGTLSSR